ncbi:hypothetical protein DRJ48_04900 [Candidatus Woesearchaeota archaeon]|nr:MAG: hypothetical protein DRJ48_04900 [Candidatus Woesearchaeota archaeon]
MLSPECKVDFEWLENYPSGERAALMGEPPRGGGYGYADGYRAGLWKKSIIDVIREHSTRKPLIELPPLTPKDHLESKVVCMNLPIERNINRIIAMSSCINCPFIMAS